MWGGEGDISEVWKSTLAMHMYVHHCGNAKVFGHGTVRCTNGIEQYDVQHREQWRALALQPNGPLKLGKRINLNL